ncbi:hypothetical protein L21SP2_2461 [Salinispira pacifica]|uniref:Uncharacterized protein n=1 Tax=Salinispira pacifica TaxID=1307761 RepID=V5WJQ6_9SPIO|nr:hypothetical protein L21SP2_2461 [Salinispira pacifica]
MPNHPLCKRKFPGKAEERSPPVSMGNCSFGGYFPRTVLSCVPG